MATLEAHEFVNLDAKLRELQNRFETDKACEARAWIGLNAFNAARQELRPHLDAWVEAMPDAWTARSARAAHWTRVGFSRRGQRLARDTSPDAFAAMNEAFQAAASDLARAIELEPRHLLPYLCGIEIGAAQGDAAVRDRFLAAAVEADPASFVFREKAIHWYGPEWGGSIARIHRIADDAQARLQENPRLVRLRAQAKAREASELAKAGSSEQAIALYEEAAAICPCWSVDELFRLLQERGEHRRVIRAANRVDEWWRERGSGAAGWVLAYRAVAYFELGDGKRARADFERAAEIAPRDADVQRQMAVFVAITQGKAAAIPHYERALALNPNHPSLVQQFAEALQADPDRRAEAVSVLAGLTERDPENARAWLAYGTLLHELGQAEARPALERYLALADASDPEARARHQVVQRMLQGGGGSGDRAVAANALPALARVTAQVEARRASTVSEGTR